MSLANPEPQVASTYQSAPIDASKNGVRTLVSAPGPKKQVWVYGLCCSASASGTALFRDSAQIALSGSMTLDAGIPLVMPISTNGLAPWWKCATNTALQVVLSADPNLGGVLVYAIVDV